MKNKFSIKFVTREGSEKEGPLVLLWELIESYEVDIFKVSLTKITYDFIESMSRLQLNLEDKSQFVLMAARLIYYKSKLLLPDPGYEEEYQDDVLPIELVDQLLEYKKFEKMALTFREMESHANMSFSPKEKWNDYCDENYIIKLDLIPFIKVFQNFLLEKERLIPEEIDDEEYTLETIIDEIRNLLKVTVEFSFLQTIKNYSILKVVIVFFAFLELCKLKEVRLRQDSQYSDIIVFKI